MRKDTDGALESLIAEHYDDLTKLQRKCAVNFHDYLVRANKTQNLTRLTSYQDFIERHLEDVVQLYRSGFVQSPALDFGSGCGVPGILYAILFSGDWVLVDSERRKIEFLNRCIRNFDLSNVAAVWERGEVFLKSSSNASTVVARAVGSVTKLYRWMRGCSTWNSMVLFKGPRWEVEWQTFRRGPHRNELEIEKVHYYSKEIEESRRKIIKLIRVPRGTDPST